MCVKYEKADCSKQSYPASFSGHSLLQVLREGLGNLVEGGSTVFFLFFFRPFRGGI